MARTLFARFGPVGLALLALGVPADATAQVDMGRTADPEISVKIWTGGGTLRIEAWERDSVHVDGEVEVGRAFFSGGGTAAKLGLEGPQTDVRGELVVRVPVLARVWIRAVDAHVEVDDVRGSLDVRSVSGNIVVTGRPAHLHVESMGGDLRLDCHAPIVRAHTGSGRLVFRGSANDLTLETVEGAIVAETSRLRRGHLATIEGRIRFAGDLERGGSLEVEAHSGDVTLHLPPDLAADFDLSTFEGSIRTGAGSRDRVATADDQALQFETGDGGAEVVVRTFSGAIELTGLEVAKLEATRRP